MKTSKETPIDQKKYRFKPDPPQRIKKTISIRKDLYSMVHRLSVHEGIPFNRALEKLLDTEEARALAPSLASKMMANARSTSKRIVFNTLFNDRNA